MATQRGTSATAGEFVFFWLFGPERATAGPGKKMTYRYSNSRKINRESQRAR
jgi:hypothetical protein